MRNRCPASPLLSAAAVDGRASASWNSIGGVDALLRMPPAARRPSGCTSRVRSLRVLGLFLAILLLHSGWADAQTASPGISTAETSKIDRLEQKLESVEETNRRLFEEIQSLKEQLGLRAPVAPAPLPPLDAAGAASNGPADSLPSTKQALTEPSAWPPPAASQPSVFDEFRIVYDKGFAIVPTNADTNPFSLKINHQSMFRYSAFSRDADSWIDSAGNQIPINNSNNLQIPRGRLIFSGNVLLPNLTYLLNIDYNTVTSNPIGFRAYVLSYRFNRAMELHVGQSKVPGTREWLESGFAALEGPDRSMATTFFRPSLSQGVWFTGEPIDGLHYHVMMSNGFNTLNVRPNQLNNRFCWSGSTWWEPWGDFGSGYADLQHHETPVIRLGGSFTFALGQGSSSDSNAVENSSTRLSDGTMITQLGAFAPGVTLVSYDLSLAAVDLAFKYRGLSLSTECYAQSLSSLQGDGPLPLDSTQAYGGFLQGGYFVLPQRVELYSRTSFVTGRYGSGSEIAGGFNWFILPGKSNLRFTFDTAWLESSPADQNRTGYVAGQTGLLFRTQITATY